MENWVDAMINRFKISCKGIDDGVFYLTNDDKIKAIKQVDYEAFSNLFLLVVNGVLDIDLTRRLDIRKTKEYKYWHKDILKRDNYRCSNCGSNKSLEVHHIKSLRFYPELAIDLDNGITLCNSCHKKTDNYGYKSITNYGKL